MKKILSLSILIILLTAPSWAQEQKTIQLKDGTLIKGEIADLSDGVYTVYSDRFGKISLKEEEISQITSGKEAPKTTSPSTAEIKDYTQQMQRQMMSDPAVLQEMQRLAEDEDIQKILSDPAFMNAVFSYDPDTIMNNEGTQQLLNNPKMKQMMEMLSNKYMPDEEKEKEDPTP